MLIYVQSPEILLSQYEANQMAVNERETDDSKDDSITDQNESSLMPLHQKLDLAERANEIYRQQLKNSQDHVASSRSSLQDKENIIDNLMLRYDGGIITQDPSSLQRGNLCADEIEETELRSKADALAQRTILENYELREMVNDLRDENQHLRHEIYDLVC